MTLSTNRINKEINNFTRLAIIETKLLDDINFHTESNELTEYLLSLLQTMDDINKLNKKIEERTNGL